MLDLILRGARTPTAVVDIGIAAYRIAWVGTAPEGATAKETIDASRLLVLPALANAHAHSMELFQRGSVCCLPLEVYRLRIVDPTAPAPTPQEVYARTLCACVEMLLDGIGLVLDDVLHQPYLSAESWDAVMRAYSDSGMRARVSMHLEDLSWDRTIPFLADELPRPDADRLAATLSLPDAGEALAVVRDVLSGAGRDDRVRPMVAPSAPQRCSDELLGGLAELSAEFDVPLHVHALETPVQAVTGPVLFGGSLIRRLDNLGALSPRTTIAHAVWADADEIALIAERGAAVVHNPVSNLKLGSGIAPAIALREAGVRTALGCDGYTCNDGQSIFEAMKLAAALSAVTTPDYERWLTPEDVLEMATVNGYRSALTAGGTLRAGAPADLALLRLDTPAHIGANDRLQQAVFSGHEVDTVIVDGRVVVRDGRTTLVDQDAVRAEASRYAEARGGGTQGTFAALEPHFARAYRRSIDALGPRWSERMGASLAVPPI
jgi:5-methylthioadenosine/S-adenosylhomocysteine deaminase